MMNQNCNSTITFQPDTSETTLRLLSAFQAGDANAFSRLYDLHVNILFNYGYKLTTDRELLKDCIHDVFVRLYVRRSEVTSIENFKSYIFTSLKNKLCDEVRKRMYQSDTAIEDLDPIASDDVENTYLDNERENINNYMIDYLLNQLSPRQREALTLYYLEEKKYEDICEIMSMNYQSVRNLMHRGLSKLRSIAG